MGETRATTAPPFGQKGALLHNASIAQLGGEVKRPSTASRGDSGDGTHGNWLRMPRVLRDLPTSCRLVFAAFVCLADAGGKLQISTRELAKVASLSETQARRAVKRLVAVRLLEQLVPGCGTQAAVFRLRWRIRTFPQPSAPSLRARNFKPSEREKFSFSVEKTPQVSSQADTPQLRGRSWEPSERAVRWALAQARDRLWGLSKPRRERALAALAVAFRWAAAQPRPWDQERWHRFVLSTLAKFGDGPDGITGARRRPFGWAMRCAGEALAELADQQASIEATEELVQELAQARAEAEREWANYTGPSWRELAGLCHGDQICKLTERGKVKSEKIAADCRTSRGVSPSKPSPEEAGGAGDGKAEPVSGSAPPAAEFSWHQSRHGGWWVLGRGDNLRREEGRTMRPTAKTESTEERLRRLEAEAHCGDPEREALARVLLSRLMSKKACS